MSIFLVRRGESIGNLDEQAYGQFADHMALRPVFSLVALFVGGPTQIGPR